MGMVYETADDEDSGPNADSTQVGRTADTGAAALLEVVTTPSGLETIEGHEGPHTSVATTERTTSRHYNGCRSHVRFALPKMSSACRRALQAVCQL